MKTIIIDGVEYNLTPKALFKKGDWVKAISSGNIFKILSVNDGLYRVLCYDGVEANYPIEVEKDLAYWTIQDAKDGDVLADGNLPFIFKKIDANNYSYAYCGISVDDCFKIKSEGKSGEWTWMQDIKPSTKEQRDLLFQKMKEAGYEWDDEKKELRKIDGSLTEDNLPEFESYLCLMFQKFRTKGMCTNGEIIDFVKEHSQKLKDTLCHAWSEEDRETIDYLIDYLESELDSSYTKEDKEEFTKEIELLKSLIPHSQWKPSDEQMDALEDAIADAVSSIQKNMLNSLYSDLKKLREE